MPAPRLAVPLLLAAVCVAALLVHIRSLVYPVLLHDDFDLILKAWTWEGTRDTLWVPMNEHAWPLTRLWTRAVVWVSGSAAGLPLIAALANRVLLLAAVVLTYLFVRRERGHPAPGLVAAAMFGVSAVYQEAVYWFAASPAVGAVATGLLALLAAQRWRQSDGFGWLLLSAVGCALAPGWFAGGILIGPLCALYLIGCGSGSTNRGRWWAWLIPALGSAAFLAVNLRMAGDRIMNADHYGGKTAVQAFAPFTGAWNALRAMVDCSAIGAIGAPPVATPVWVAVPALVALIVGLVWWWRRSADRRLVTLGIGFAFVSYWLIHSARAGWEYSTLVNWSRYGVFPQFGLAIALGGGWSGQFGTPFTRRQAHTVVILVAVLTLLQIPRGLLGAPGDIPEQADVLRLIDAVDGRCLAEEVSAADAVAALPAEDIPGSQYSRWRYLRGSTRPRERTAAERADLRRVLLP